jgi:glycine/D-amino acid oxidase-like deaminating enzyme
MTNHAVVIVGGGPTGLMLAGELALAGVDVAIVEREGHPGQRAASICHRRWHERARQPRPQLSAAVERCAQPGSAGHPLRPCGICPRSARPTAAASCRWTASLKDGAPIKPRA